MQIRSGLVCILHSSEITIWWCLWVMNTTRERYWKVNHVSRRDFNLISPLFSLFKYISTTQIRLHIPKQLLKVLFDSIVRIPEEWHNWKKRIFHPDCSEEVDVFFKRIVIYIIQKVRSEDVRVTFMRRASRDCLVKLEHWQSRPNPCSRMTRTGPTKLTTGSGASSSTRTCG